jgi:hypothetical protein
MSHEDDIIDNVKYMEWRKCGENKIQLNRIEEKKR